MPMLGLFLRDQDRHIDRARHTPREGCGHPLVVWLIEHKATTTKMMSRYLYFS